MTDGRKKIVILGSTGSIGSNAIEIVKLHRDKFEVAALAAGRRVELLANQASELGCKQVICANKQDLPELKSKLNGNGQASSGCEAMIEAVCAPDVDMVLCAIIGTGGLLPVMAAIEAGKDIALASKEVLVMAGEIVMAAARRSGSRIIPVDSEHCAIFQCLDGRNCLADISRLILTSSGGPFRKASLEQIQDATLSCALAHPVWEMGRKITIDSATMMNKALEIIEAKFLFGVAGNAIEVLVHPQSIVHSMVEFIDGTLLAQMSVPDMRFPIQYALSWPQKYPRSMERLDLTQIASLEFHAPDRKRFPSLDFAYDAMKRGGTAPTVMNAANEIAVERFLNGEIKLPGIWKIIEKTMKKFDCGKADTIEAILETDSEVRGFAKRV